jgi:hypothetical protein
MILLLECLIPLLQFEKQIPHSAIEKMTTTTSVLYVPNKEARNLNYHPNIITKVICSNTWISKVVPSINWLTKFTTSSVSPCS